MIVLQQGILIVTKHSFVIYAKYSPMLVLLHYDAV